MRLSPVRLLNKTETIFVTDEESLTESADQLVSFLCTVDYCTDL